MLITSFTYLVFMIFARFKLIGIVAFVLVVNVLLNFSFGINLLSTAARFFLAEQSPVLLTIKLLVALLVLQVSSYLPLRNLEVNG